ncbi:hypothetical protein XENOCAPTIV_000746 [Xenoophorus captivus]|uniref:Uncharacterized protein n=1 Tax=Xenoophorus captivus TaxID=1517983 RepID=A0ABV0QXN8_9TELE
MAQYQPYVYLKLMFSIINLTEENKKLPSINSMRGSELCSMLLFSLANLFLFFIRKSFHTCLTKQTIQENKLSSITSRPNISGVKVAEEVKPSQVYLYNAFQQQGTQSVHEEKYYNDTEHRKTNRMTLITLGSNNK